MTSGHAKLDLKRLFKPVFVALVDNHIGVALGNGNLKVHLLEWDHLISVAIDSEQLESLLILRRMTTFGSRVL